MNVVLSRAPSSDDANRALAVPDQPSRSPRKPSTIDLSANPVEEEIVAQAPPEEEIAPAEPPLPPSTRPFWGSLLLAAVCGGIVGAGSVAGFEEWRRSEAVSRTTAFANRLTAIESANAALGQQLEATRVQAQKGSSRVEEVLSRPLGNEGEIGEIAKRLDALENRFRLSDEAATASAQGVERKLNGIEQQVGTLKGEIGDTPALSSDAALRLVMADRLSAALREGRPYGDLLAALRRLSPQAETQALEIYAKGGAPNGSALAQNLAPYEVEILNSHRAGAASFGERIALWAQRIVTVRALDGGARRDAATLLQEIKSALAREDFGSALAAWNALPEPDRRLSEDFGRQLKEREAAAAASRTLAADAETALLDSKAE